ncbi:MAG: ABC-F family ATP-binding cassette domain-containing protein [Bacteroidetes bacterium]|jgi:ATP-binding cassette, subfamily F, member 3|nr:ABC-F family ATP-binding cassette domain-containing protein [Bacteroidota bacterium]MDA0980105.1 ABC-F family ATP-binding cassette domain-containing protein [Bacteroidota bacterium]
MLTVTQLGVHFGDRTLFEGLNLFIGKRERIGLVGRNGAGKSTLMHILAGINVPSEGTVSYPNDYMIGYLPQEMDHNELSTVFDESASAFAEIKKLEERIVEITNEISTRLDYESTEYSRLIDELTESNQRLDIIGAGNLEEKIQRILQGLGFKPEDLERKMSEFSGGWKMRVELAKLLLTNPNLLLLDEPTNHLDIESIEWLEGFLKNYSGAILLISHDRMFLDNLTERTIEISPFRLYDFKAPYTKYQIWREEERDRQLQAQKNQKKYIEETQVLINKFRAKKNKAAFAQSLIKKLDKLEIVDVDAADNAKIKFRFPPAPRTGKVIFDAKGLGKSFNELNVFKGLEFMMARRDKVAFVGKNGAGKTTLTRILLDLESFDGELIKGHNVDIGYYAQNQAEELDGKITVLQTLEAEVTIESKVNLRSMLGSFLFSGEDVDKKVSVLSGGEKARLALCKLLLHPYNVLILDEPTNHLDLKSKTVLKDALENFDGSLIVVSHDRDFLSGLTEFVYEVTPTGLRQYIGDIKIFLHAKHAESIGAYEASKTGERVIGKGKNSKLENNSKKSDSTIKIDYKKKKELEKAIKKVDKKINRLEKSVAEAEKELELKNQVISEVDSADMKLMTNLSYEFEEIQKRHDSFIMEWENALILKEELEDQLS